MLLSDIWLKNNNNEIITPFEGKEVKKEGVPSYGLSSFGYDLRIEESVPAIVIPSKQFMLASSKEYIKMPRDMMGFVYLKSTYSRLGLIANTGVLEPEWEGNITFEIFNASDKAVEIITGGGVFQLCLVIGDQPCFVSYKDKNGRYQCQKGITEAIY